MRIAVIKLGSRISFNANDTSGGNGEARSIVRMLQQGGAEVHIYTKTLKKDNLLPEFTWHNLSDSLDLQTLNRSDALVILNGNVNFFGGAEDVEQLRNYEIINHFDGPVFYIYCDPELTLKQVWPSVAKKEWAGNWRQINLEITRSDIIYLSQPHDVKKVFENFSKNEIIPSQVIHYPFEKFPCLNERLEWNPDPEVDLSYGGTMRGGKREKKMVKFYFGHPEDISVEMFGKIQEKDFSPKHAPPGLRRPTFTGAIRYDEMLPKMNKAMAHCVIGDPYYEEINDMAQRAYESIWSKVVTFIDTDLDQLRRVYGRDPVLAEFLYVSSREELTDKLRLLKEDVNLRRTILASQLEAINFNADEYCKNFVDLIKALS
jgi:hypothetical protein